VEPPDEGDRPIAVFNPWNEPYLGRASVEKFDKAIVACLDANTVLAQRSRCIQLSRLQEAACQLIPQGVKLALSIRELVRQGYLFPARVLMRSLIERAAIIFYLEQHPDRIGVWQNGWRYRERPSLAAMLRELGDRRLPHIQTGPSFTSEYNSLTHGDPDSAVFNLSFTEDGEPVFAVSKDLDSPEVCDRVCSEATVWLGELFLTANRLFPESADEAPLR
jgi:hypothetical protein